MFKEVNELFVGRRPGDFQPVGSKDSAEVSVLGAFSSRPNIKKRKLKRVQHLGSSVFSTKKSKLKESKIERAEIFKEFKNHILIFSLELTLRLVISS